MIFVLHFLFGSVFNLGRLKIVGNFIGINSNVDSLIDYVTKRPCKQL